MATVGSDTFVETVNTALELHTPDVGALWTEEAAQFTVIAATDVLEHAIGTHMARKGDNIGDDDMDVSADCKSASNANRIAGVVGRMASADFNNGYQSYLQGDGTAVDVNHFKEVAGVRTSLGSWNGNLAANIFVALKQLLRTASQEVQVAGISRITSTDTELVDNNFAGIFMNGNADSTKVAVDNFLSESVAAADTLFAQSVM